MDDKRFIRNLKREIKKTGNKKRRQYYKDLSVEEEFDFGPNASSVLNGQDNDKTRKKRNAEGN